MNQSTEHWSEAIEKLTGKQIMMNTSECVIWKMEKDTCKECPHELNCARLASIKIIQYNMASYKPNDFLDQMRTGLVASDMIEFIMKAKTVEEIDNALRGEKK